MLPLCNATPLLASCLHFNDDLSLDSISSWMEAANQMNQFLMVVQQLDERSGIEQKMTFCHFNKQKSQKFASRVENRFFARIYQSEQELLHLRIFSWPKGFAANWTKRWPWSCNERSMFVISQQGHEEIIWHSGLVHP